MTSPRRTLIDLDSTPYYHCMARCVRRTFLCGEDSLTGNSYEHRKHWVTDRLKELASIFAIEACAHVVISNHYHVVLHVDAQTQKVGVIGKCSNAGNTFRWPTTCAAAVAGVRLSMYRDVVDALQCTITTMVLKFQRHQS